MFIELQVNAIVHDDDDDERTMSYECVFLSLQLNESTHIVDECNEIIIIIIIIITQDEI